MSRPLRIQFNGAWYHVMNRGASHKTIFFNNSHREKFLELLSELTSIYGVEVHAYCLMDNHYHLILHTPRGNISQSVRHLNSKFAQYVNITMGKDGPLFKGRFKAIVISADEYLIRLSRYIHRNPLAAKIIKNLSTYKWSSYSYYLDKISPDWLVTREILERFGRDYPVPYKQYVENSEDKELEQFYSNPKFQPVLGGNDYRTFIFDEIKSHSLSSEIIGANNILVPPDFASILENVATYYRVTVEEIRKSSHGKRNIARQVAILLCRELGGYQLIEIANVFGNVSDKTISSAIYRARSDKNLMNDVMIVTMNIRKNLRTINEHS